MSSNLIILDYVAKQKQRQFHQSGSKYRLYIGGWRAGKTYAGCQEALKQSILYPKNCGLIGRKDFTDLRDTTLVTFLEICPPELIKDYNKTEHRIVLQNGSEILFRELKDGIGLGSLNLGWFYIDEAEQVEENVFTRLQGRLSLARVGRQCGWMTSNPPNIDHWIHQKFHNSKDPDYFTIHAMTYENRENLPEGYIADLEKMPPSWRKKYLEGQYGFTPDGTPFYNGFLENLHRRSLQPNLEQTFLRGWDYGYHHPACVISQIDQCDRWCILKEMMGTDIILDKFADNVIAVCNEHYPNATFIDYGDPAGNQVNDKSEKTSIELLRLKGIQVRSRKSEYRQRKEVIEKKLSTMISGIPSLIVDDSCHVIIDGFLGGYHYPEKTEAHPIVETPEKDGFYEHLMNALEYVAVGMFSNQSFSKMNVQETLIDNYLTRR